MAYDKKSFLYGVVDAINKNEEAKRKLKTELVKAKLQSQMRQEEQQARAGVQEERDKITNPQRYTPEQQYLRRRYLEENPLAAMVVPQEGEDMSGFVGPNPNQVIQDPKTKQMVATQGTPMSLEQSYKNMSAKVAEMQAQGRQPHPKIKEILDLQRKEIERRSSSKGLDKLKVAARKMATNKLSGKFSVAKYEESLKALMEADQELIQPEIISGNQGDENAPDAMNGGDGTELENSAETIDETPEWAKGKIDYANAKSEGYSDDQIKQFLGV